MRGRVWFGWRESPSTSVLDTRFSIFDDLYHTVLLHVPLVEQQFLTMTYSLLCVAIISTQNELLSCAMAISRMEFPWQRIRQT